MNIGEPITVLIGQTSLTDLAPGAVVEANVITQGGQQTPAPWHQWKLRGHASAVGSRGFVYDSDEGRTWLHGWGGDKKAALLLVRSAA